MKTWIFVSNSSYFFLSFLHSLFPNLFPFTFLSILPHPGTTIISVFCTKPKGSVSPTSLTSVRWCWWTILCWTWPAPPSCSRTTSMGAPPRPTAALSHPRYGGRNGGSEGGRVGGREERMEFRTEGGTERKGNGWRRLWREKRKRGLLGQERQVFQNRQLLQVIPRYYHNPSHCLKGAVIWTVHVWIHQH